MALTRRVWGAGKLLVIGGALILTYVLFAAIGMRLALKSREVQVPTLGAAAPGQSGRTLASSIDASDSQAHTARLMADETGGFAITASTICDACCARICRPHSQQCGVPARANRTRR